MHKQLAATYYDIDSRNTRPQAQTDLRGYCKAVWCSGGDFTLTDDIYELYETLAAIIGGSGILFEPTGGQGALHWTLFQFQTFPVEVAVTAAEKEKDREDALEIGKMIAEFPPIHIEFKGLVRTRYGLFLAGYPSWDVNRLRMRFRTWANDRGGGDAIREPHPQDIFHATLLRFTEEPTEVQLGLLDVIVRGWRERQLGELRAHQWHYGYGTWLQGGAQLPRLIASWPSGPAHWILHRGLSTGPSAGLSTGPSAALENRQDLLCAAMEAGWEVELDIWSVGGQLYLGHDWDSARQQPLTEPFFLRHKRAWVHCKNMEALAYMVEAEGACRYFVHDTDEATLTNKGEPWCYPGKWAGRRSICVLPERSATAAEAASAAFGLQQQIAGVCSDYLPAHFLTADLFTFDNATASQA